MALLIHVSYNTKQQWTPATVNARLIKEQEQQTNHSFHLWCLHILTTYLLDHWQDFSMLSSSLSIHQSHNLCHTRKHMYQQSKHHLLHVSNNLLFFYTQTDTYHYFIFVLGYIFYHQPHIYTHMRYVLLLSLIR